MSAELVRLAAACVLPGFPGPVAPDWVRRRLAEGLGGVVLFAWNVESREQLAALTASLRAENEDVLIGIDEEGGDVTRLETAHGSSYPGNAALGAVDDVGLTEQVAAAIGSELAAVGINVDLAPVADVNTNPLNPVIGVRSFGADGDRVARHVAAFVRGLQATGVAACAKHFPGHGDTAEDSHHQLPVVATLEEAALLPFRAAVEAGVRCVMTAHIVVRSLGDEPATMSPRVLRELLREELGFGGLVMTDALEMRAISATVGVEEGAVRALAAGVDAIGLGHDLFDEATRSVIAAIVDAVRAGRLTESRLVEAAGRVREVSHLPRAAAPGESVDSSIGREAARRAVVVEGTANLAAGALVVELAPEPGMAAGALPEGPGDWFADVVPGTDVVRLHDGDVGDALRAADGRQIVLIARDAYRHAWQRDALATLLAAAPDAIVVEVGLPHWRPEAATSYVTTHGAGRVNVQAAAERLYSGVATRGGAVR
jgi:beta-N-acetylhexosaminidase